MENFASYLLDVLGEFGGGRGSPQNDYVRFGLGGMMFAGLLVWAMRKRRQGQSDRESLLIVGFAFGLSREVFMFAVMSLKLQGVYQPETLELFFPPIEHALLTVSRVVIAGAFIKYLLRSRVLAHRFILFGCLSVLLFYALVAPSWWQSVASDPDIRFGKHWGDWMIHIIGFLISAAAIMFFWQARGWARTAIIIAFTLILFGDLLMILNLWSQDMLKAAITPIRHTLHLLAIATLGHIYARERNNEHHRVAQQLQQDERIRSVGQLAAGVAHDFNNQLQAILGFAELARAKSGHDPEALRQIEVSGNRAAKLVNKLLVFSRINGETSATCEIDTVLTGLGPMLGQLLGARYQMQMELDAPRIHINISATDAEQIITNLVVNARDAIIDGGHIRIRTDVLLDDTGASKFLRLTVADNGAGMDARTLTHAFDPFFSSKPFGSGAGLGLATVYGIVDRAGGSVRTDSTVGVGTTQKITFMIVPPSEDIALPNTPLRRPVGAMRILVADDEPAILHYTTTVLEAAGHVVIPATNGREAVNRAKAHRDEIDLLLLDINMPELSGYQAHQDILGFIPNVPVLFVSGADGQSKSAAAHPHIRKPFNREKLLSAIATVMDVID